MAQRLPLILRMGVIAALVAAGGWAFTESIVTIEGSVSETLSNPIERWVQVGGTALCVGAVAALSWSPSVRYGGIAAALALLVSAGLAIYVWSDVESVTPRSLFAARDLALQDCGDCEATLAAGFSIVVAVLASIAGALAAGFIALMAKK